MVDQANRVWVRLWRDESGVVLALSAVVFLMLFVMAVACFAIGETVRERVELQNAADAGAYSGAIVQADTLSRIAAINRAMAWTWVMMNRMDMDAVVDKWLKLVVDKWDQDDQQVSQFNASGSCNFGRPQFFWNGISQGQDKQVMLNQHHMVQVQQIKQARQQAAGQQKGYEALKPKIQQYRQIIKDMNKAEAELIRKLKDRVEKAVKDVVLANIKETENDRLAGGADIKHVCLQNGDYFRMLKNKEQEEKEFLAHADFFDGPKETYKKGTDKWWVRQPEGQDGFHREYRQQSNMLLAEWRWYSSKWVMTDDGCQFAGQIQGQSKVKGEEGYDSAYYETEKAEPQVLKEEFFARDGSIIVGVRRKVNNPLTFLFSGGPPGIYKAFTLPGGNRHMWTASAAMAGYMSPKDPGDGNYEVTFEKVELKKLWNLKTSDWDAELLPLHRARAKGQNNRSWNGDTAGQILQEVRGKLGIGSESAPRPLAGGVPSYGGMEGWVVH